MADQKREQRVESESRLVGGRFLKGRQHAYESFTSNSLCTRQTPEQFGGVSTD